MTLPAREGPARYLIGGDDQRRLLDRMADGHARKVHGEELGNPTRAEYQQRVRRHLEHAPLGYRADDGSGRPGYLLLDPGTGGAAWLNPHKEGRSTYFEPPDGVVAYLRAVRTTKPQLRLTRLDLAHLRSTPTRVHCADRSAATDRSRNAGLTR